MFSKKKENRLLEQPHPLSLSSFTRPIIHTSNHKWFKRYWASQNRYNVSERISIFPIVIILGSFRANDSLKEV